MFFFLGTENVIYTPKLSTILVPWEVLPTLFSETAVLLSFNCSNPGLEAVDVSFEQDVQGYSPELVSDVESPPRPLSTPRTILVDEKRAMFVSIILCNCSWAPGCLLCAPLNTPMSGNSHSLLLRLCGVNKRGCELLIPTTRLSVPCRHPLWS